MGTGKRLAAGAAALIAVTWMSAAGASAATEVGRPCVADDTVAEWTLLVSGSSGLPVPPVVPAEGVITRWTVKVGKKAGTETAIGPLQQQLQVFQVVNEQEEYRKVAESAVETVAEGTNSFATRIPVTEGNSIGLHGPVETVFCDKIEGEISALHKGAVALGETAVFKAEPDVGTPLTALVEPDRDQDGYGDETQDGCPTGSAYQGECPTVALRSRARVRKRSILLIVTSSAEASVRVFGQVGWGIRTRGRRSSAEASARARLIVGLRGGIRDLLPGQTARFPIRLPKPVLRRLSRIGPRQSLRAKLTLVSTDLAGRTRNTRLSVRLRGREKS